MYIYYLLFQALRLGQDPNLENEENEEENEVILDEVNIEENDFSLINVKLNILFTFLLKNDMINSFANEKKEEKLISNKDNSAIEELRKELESSLGFAVFKKVYKLVDNNVNKLSKNTRLTLNCLILIEKNWKNQLLKI